MFPPLMTPAAKRPSGDFRNVDFWVFDLDNTLYPAASGLFVQIDERMRRFVRTRFGVDDEGARAIQKGYYKSYGTTLTGLMVEHGVDPHEFCGFVHDIDVSALAPNPGLRESIAALPGRKVVFTNGSAMHAERITRQLGLAQSFDGVMDIFALDFRPKPHEEAFAALFARFGATPSSAAMFEDLPRNLVTAHRLGMTTVLVTGEHPWRNDGPPPPDDYGDFVHHQTDDLTSFLRELTRATT
jgi:putative hydrolase of the HAD superfamily